MTKPLVRGLRSGGMLAAFIISGCGGSSPKRTTNDSAVDGPDAGAEVASNDSDNNGDALVATPPPDFIWYVLDETAGTTAKDSSPNHKDISNLTGVTWSQGAVFDGVSCGGSTTVDPSYRVPPITITAWLTPRARADEALNQYVLVPYPTNAIGDDLPGAFGYGIGLNVWTDVDGGAALSAEDLDTCHGPINGTVTCDLKGNPGAAGAAFVADREYFVSVTVSSSLAAAVFVDGALFQTTTAATLAPSTETTLYLGRHNDDPGYGSKRFFAGRMRDVRIYKRQLEAAEIAQLFTNGPTVTAPAP